MHDPTKQGFLLRQIAPKSSNPEVRQNLRRRRTSDKFFGVLFLSLIMVLLLILRLPKEVDQEPLLRLLRLRPFELSRLL